MKDPLELYLKTHTAQPLRGPFRKSLASLLKTIPVHFFFDRKGRLRGFIGISCFISVPHPIVFIPRKNRMINTWFGKLNFSL
jgi:hypothetical protein